MTFWKAVRLNGTDFRTGAIRYEVGAIVTHPAPDLTGGAGGYLSISDTPTECTGMEWPCRLFEVEPVGDHRRVEDLPHKTACVAVRVVREVDSHLALGPQGEAVASLIDRASQLTEDDADRLAAAWNATRDAAWDAAWNAARYAAWNAARNAAWNATLNATLNVVSEALIVRDLTGTHGFTQEHYNLLTRPWRSVIGPIHPDDPDITTEES